ncbi:MAG TPA: aminopeptidase P family protein [Chloroflexia bacterium]|nr:aminopeptidase P family protein [Chloroflexia bacterium]
MGSTPTSTHPTRAPAHAGGPADLAGRQTRVRAALAAQDLPALLVSQAENIRYLSGFTGEGLLLVTAADVRLLTDSRFTIQAAQEAPDVILVQRDPRQIPALAAEVGALGVARLGFEAQHLRYSQYEDLHTALPQLALVPTRGLIDGQRAVKDAAELALIRRAVAIADQAFDEVSQEIRPGQTERQVARLIETRMIDLGAEGPAFPLIVAAGPNSAMAHAVPSDRPIGAGEPLVIDMGARYQGYNSDMTRTLILGPPDAKFKEIYNIVLRAQLAGEFTARSGLSGHAIDAVTRTVIQNAGYGDHFGHGTGHGIGLEVHEPPRVSHTGSEALIDDSVVISVEPGIYLEGWGGVRIEDLVLLHPSGAEVLTQARKHHYYD